MSGLLENGDRRAHLLASFEFGVSPLLPKGLYTRRRLVMDEAWRICGECGMPYADDEPSRRAHVAVKGHLAVDGGPWTEVGP